MTKIDLITGFLGSGKTTFLKPYTKYFLEKGEKICIIENDFGAINVDMVLLKDIAGENCNIEMIIGGDGAQAHKRRLKTKLISIGMAGYDRVIIEPSGIFDPDELFDTLYEEPLDNWYEMNNIICILDVELDDELSKESRFILMSEAACAGKIVLSKLNNENFYRKELVISILNDSMKEFSCNRKIDKEDVVAKDWKELNCEDYALITAAGYKKAEYVKETVSESMAYQTLFYFDFSMSKTEFEKVVKEMFDDPECGRIFRIKGFIDTGEEKKTEINATRTKFIIGDTETDRAVLIVIGESLNRERLKKYIGEPSI
ncbi:GTPase (G3E family) [Butyrivibrio sp. X503]|uniref:GTP-binding protein n=1 Tax=Butyrivibrio sp. X503 TaxID=2364878 RepID=UPI000EA9FCC3|nr:GTP-binding protein [Butyrivibrio sp. X503]RKM53978.1 GTPase (G3E family) [Butyrivibrio sp. X503]